MENNNWFNKKIEDVEKELKTNTEKGLTEANAAEVENQLSAYKSGLSKEELEALIDQTKALKKYQEEPSSEEDLSKLPMLKREDLKKNALEFSNIETSVNDIKVVRHDISTNGIDYINFIYDTKFTILKYLNIKSETFVNRAVCENSPIYFYF